ncbi:MAG: shikimate kinase [bacterium]
MKPLVLIVGPPAVGKMTVGQALSNSTGFPLLHNHMSIELALKFFEFGEPGFDDLNRALKNTIVQSVARSDHAGFIMTWVWAFDLEADAEGVSDLVSRWREMTGSDVLVVELSADETVKKQRNVDPDRLAAKPSKADVVASEARRRHHESHHQLNSGGTLPLPLPHLLIDNSTLSPAAVAQQICQWAATEGFFDQPA